ncbi:MAG: BACON domain-containing protein [Bacteroidales bacterium]|nr:BACON domain-containing protein [Bacteroidales bacterium]
MKLRNIILSAGVAAMTALGFASCARQYEFKPSSNPTNITLSQESLTVKKEGGVNAITISSNRPWHVEFVYADQADKDWIKVDPMEGNKTKDGIETFTVNVNIQANPDGNKERRDGGEAYIKFISDEGIFASLLVEQDGDVVRPVIGGKGTIDSPFTTQKARELLLGGTAPTGTVHVKGIIYQLEDISVQYGNATYWISDDGTDNKNLAFEVYRGYYLNGEKVTAENEKCFQVGDTVQVKGVLSLYGSTCEFAQGNEMVFRWESSIKKPTVETGAWSVDENYVATMEGVYSAGDFAVSSFGIKYKEEGASDWTEVVATTSSQEGQFSVTAQCEAEKKYVYAAFVKYDTEEVLGKEVKFNTLSYVESTVADFLAAAVGDTPYKLTGRVCRPNEEETEAGNKFDLATYGNFIIEDATGRAYVYGVLTAKGGEKGQFGTLGVNEGDVITIIGLRAAYKEAPQVGSAYYVSHETVTKISVADFLAKGTDDTSWYELTGVVTDPQGRTTPEGGTTKFDLANYGNFDLTDASGFVYIYGVVPGVGGQSKQFGTLEVAEGDTITIVGRRAVYKGLDQVKDAWFVSKTKAE